MVCADLLLQMLSLEAEANIILGFNPPNTPRCDWGHVLTVVNPTPLLLAMLSPFKFFLGSHNNGCCICKRR